MINQKLHKALLWPQSHKSLPEKLQNKVSEIAYCAVEIPMELLLIIIQKYLINAFKSYLSQA